MPLPISHGFVGAAIVAAVHPKIKGVFTVPLFVGGFLANAADLDFALYLPGDLGFELVPGYDWHRGFSHSILFSFLLFLAIALWSGRDRLRASAAYGLAYFSHVVLDYAATVKGGGLELFWFASSNRYRLGLVSLSEQPGHMSFLEILLALSLEGVLFGSLFLAVFYGKKIFDPPFVLKI